MSTTAQGPSLRGWRKSLNAVWLRLRGGELTAWRVAASLGLGGFIGCLPLYGLHWLLCLAVCLPLRLDTVLTYVAANVSNPLLAPLILALELHVGSLLLSGHGVALDRVEASWEFVGQMGANVIVGALVVATLVGLGFALLAYAVTSALRGRDR